MLMSGRPHRYFSLHYRMLRFLGLGWWHHPDEDNFDNFQGWYLLYSIITQLIWVVGFVGLETIDPFIGNKDKDRFMFSLSFVITHDLTLIKLYLFYFRNRELQEIVKTIEISMYQHYQNDENNRKTVRITRIMTGSFVFFGWATIANSNINGVIQDSRWKASLNQNSTNPARSLAQPIFIPWNYQDDGSYIATFILEAAGLLWTGHIVMFIDTFIASLILHMSNQFKILQEAISTVYERSKMDLDSQQTIHTSGIVINNDVHGRSRFKKQFEIILSRNIRNCIMQHQILIGCVQKFAVTYSYGFLTQLLSSMAAICVVMVQVSKDASTFKSVSFATSLAFFIAMIIQLAIQCFTGNELTIQAAGVSDAVMRSRWEQMPPRMRRPLLLMMLRAQRPLRLTAAGFTSMDNSCFLSIVKAAYSYYAVLSQKGK